MEQILTELSKYGFAGVVLAWHLLVTNKAMGRIEEALNRLTMASLLRLTATANISESVKEEASAILEQATAAEEARKKKIL